MIEKIVFKKKLCQASLSRGDSSVAAAGTGASSTPGLAVMADFLPLGGIRSQEEWDFQK